MATKGGGFHADVVVVGACVVVSYWLATALQLGERLKGWSRAHESWDEAILGGVVAVLGLCLCLGRRTRALRREERERQSDEDRCRATFEHAGVGIALVAPDGHWLHVNQNLCDALGYRREELRRLTFQDITHPDDIESDLSLVRRLLTGEMETYSMEKRYVRKDRAEVWAKLTVRLMRTPDGKPDYFISVVEDIGRRKRDEEAQARQREELETLNQSMIGRELRIVELKKEVNFLAQELGLELPYPPVWEAPAAAAEQATELAHETRTGTATGFPAGSGPDR